MYQWTLILGWKLSSVWGSVAFSTTEWSAHTGSAVCFVSQEECEEIYTTTECSVKVVLLMKWPVLKQLTLQPTEVPCLPKGVNLTAFFLLDSSRSSAGEYRSVLVNRSYSIHSSAVYTLLYLQDLLGILHLHVFTSVVNLEFTWAPESCGRACLLGKVKLKCACFGELTSLEL